MTKVTSAPVTFRAHPPTGTVLLTDEVFIGEDPAGGGTDLDASETYDLTAALAGFEPHPIQGFHVKLTVNAEGSQGADVKHKVFWVTCEKPPPTTSTSSTTSTTKFDKPGTIIIEKYAASYGDQPFTFGRSRLRDRGRRARDRESGFATYGLRTGCRQLYDLRGTSGGVEPGQHRLPADRR